MSASKKITKTAECSNKMDRGRLSNSKAPCWFGQQRSYSALQTGHDGGRGYGDGTIAAQMLNGLERKSVFNFFPQKEQKRILSCFLGESGGAEIQYGKNKMGSWIFTSPSFTPKKTLQIMSS